MRKLLVILFLVSASPFFGANVSNASAAPREPLFPQRITLDGTAYSAGQLADAFAEIAFSTYIRPNDFPGLIPLPPISPCIQPITDDHSICGTPAQYRSEYPWLYDFLYRDTGTPRYFAINKWTGPIRIVIGYPANLAPVAPSDDIDPATLAISDANDLTEYPPAQGDSNHDSASADTRIIEKEIAAAVPLLKDASGLNISFLTSTDDAKERMGNLRIVIERLPRNPVSQIQAEKLHPVLPAGLIQIRTTACCGIAKATLHSLSFRDAIEPYLTTAVPFTPYSNTQVDGYLLPNADNSIGMAFCFIGIHDNTPALLSALVRECLVRSLGLPAAPRLTPTMILGLWNGDTRIGLVRHEIVRSMSQHRDGQVPRVDDMSAWGQSTPPITEFDQLMIRTLYHRDIHPGMSVTEYSRLVAGHTTSQKEN